MVGLWVLLFLNNFFLFSNKVHQGGEITYNCPELEKERDNGPVMKRVSTHVSGQPDCKATRWSEDSCLGFWVRKWELSGAVGTSGDNTLEEEKMLLGLSNPGAASHQLLFRVEKQLEVPPRTKVGSSLRSPVGLPVVGLLGFRVSLFPQTSEATDLLLGK